METEYIRQAEAAVAKHVHRKLVDSLLGITASISKDHKQARTLDVKSVAAQKQQNAKLKRLEAERYERGAKCSALSRAVE